MHLPPPPIGYLWHTRSPGGGAPPSSSLKTSKATSGPPAPGPGGDEDWCWWAPSLRHPMRTQMPPFGPSLQRSVTTGPDAAPIDPPRRGICPPPPPFPHPPPYQRKTRNTLTTNPPRPGGSRSSIKTGGLHIFSTQGNHIGAAKIVGTAVGPLNAKAMLERSRALLVPPMVRMLESSTAMDTTQICILHCIA